MKSGIPNSPQCPDIHQNSDEGISDFRISAQSLIKESRRNSTTSNEIDMQIVTSLSFFQFIAKLEQSGRLIPDA